MRRLPPPLIAGAILVGLVVLVALLSLAWTPHDPDHVVIPDRFQGPSATYLLGTDQFGRDELSRIMAGARNTLLVGIVTIVIAIAVGVPVGALLFAAVFRPSTLTAMAAIGIAFVPVFARVVRGAGLQVMEMDYVTAARTFGSRGWWILVQHLLPNVANVLIVQATIAFAVAILAEAALSYLGIGTPPPTASWGRMLSDSQDYLYQSPLLALWPGLAIALSVLGFNLLGDGLRDLLDPKLVVRAPAQA